MLEDLTKFSPSVVEILKVGVSGFAFLMALLGYFLLRKEQDRDAPRAQILNMIRFFVCATLVFGALVGATVLLQKTPIAQVSEEPGHEGYAYIVESSVYFVDLTYWKRVDGPPTEKQSQVPVLRVDRVRKLKQVDEPYSLPFYSRGLEIGFEPLVSPVGGVTATFEKVPPPPDYKIAYEFQVALQRQPIGFAGDLVNRFTFWNGFQNSGVACACRPTPRCSVPDRDAGPR